MMLPNILVLMHRTLKIKRKDTFKSKYRYGFYLFLFREDFQEYSE